MLKTDNSLDILLIPKSVKNDFSVISRIGKECLFIAVITQHY